ncbi:MAG: DEAD/DEAH box helicase [Chlamydiia bacterium]|nr:DEAD/DEAH box helicase [Chlamydiia bacterium]
MPLQYVISLQEGALLVKIQEMNSRRILYWDTLLSLACAEDKQALLFFKKILMRHSRNLETLSFQQVSIPSMDILEALPLLGKTGRVVYERQPLRFDWDQMAKIYWRGDEAGRFSAHLQYREQEVPLEACAHMAPGWCIWQKTVFPFQSNVPWKWISLFSQGSVVLEGSQKRRFLEEEPSILWGKSEELPRLILADTTGCFANLLRENAEWEKDLFEVGFIRKEVGHSRYFCPSDQVRAALLLLLEVGWEVHLSCGRKLCRRGNVQLRVTEEKGAIVVRGCTRFQDKEAPLSKTVGAARAGRLWVEIDAAHAGLLEPRKEDGLEGDLIEDGIALPRVQAGALTALLDLPQVEWAPILLDAAKGLQAGGDKELALPGPSFQGSLLFHQQKGVDWLSFLYRFGFGALLADEMGLGKTVQVLAFFSRLKTKLPCLIVVPSSLLFHWQLELRRFIPSATVCVHTGADRHRKVIELQGFLYVITSYALLRMDQDLLAQIEWEVIVLDESNAIKTAATQTAQAAYQLRGRFRIALSGTPMENRPEELGSQFQFLMPGLMKTTHPDARKIKPFILRRKKEELNLPEKIEQTVWIEMEEAQSALYRSYIEGLKNGLLKKITADGAGMHRMAILEAILRLRQIAVDPRLMGSAVQGAKIERLLSDIEEALSERRKILIYSQFTSMLALVAKELSVPFLILDGSIPNQERARRVQQFQEDVEIPIFLLSLKAGGVGLNLTAADFVLLMDPWWNEAIENQAIDRTHRIGQQKTVIAKRYLCASTIEEKMLRLKKEKTKAAEDMLSQNEEFSWTEADLFHLLS